MDVEGGCYCGALRYRATGERALHGSVPLSRVPVHLGRAPELVMAMPEAEFSYTKGTPKGFRRSDLPDPVTREFCAECGTHLLTRTSRVPGVVLLKVGTFDDPSRLRRRRRS